MCHVQGAVLSKRVAWPNARRRASRSLPLIYRRRALSHPSYIRNRLTSSYERLEFLGDALLDFLITAHIFEQHQNLNPGELTDLRSALVNNVTFASYTVKLGLQKYLCSQFNPVLDSAIINFVEYQMQRNHVMTEDVLYLIDEEDCKIAEYVEVPKVLSDIFEALAGAIYLDSGGDAAAVWRVYYSIMRRELTEFAANVPWQPVRLLFENIHACPVFGDCPIFFMKNFYQPHVKWQHVSYVKPVWRCRKAQKVDEDIPRMMVPVTVTKAGVQYTVHGFGRNKAQAKRAAAKLALKMLNL
ncbi:Endoribonuclease Dcr-1 [Eumeta japonica]|uniref:Endoribonuclease Dcr-1 n=1 Tax=Eumeta variegata TaxID=151549 RepID=A0A4C1ZYZ0_EUMVA|nr:Endoribonuclease Dcr-1 [Eumeta japonica]